MLLLLDLSRRQVAFLRLDICFAPHPLCLQCAVWRCQRRFNGYIVGSEVRDVVAETVILLTGHVQCRRDRDPAGCVPLVVAAADRKSPLALGTTPHH